MILQANKVTKIVTSKVRVYLLVGNLSDTTVYISANEYPEVEDYLNNSFALKLNGILEINPCMYQGSFYAYTTEESDIRVLEL